MFHWVEHDNFSKALRRCKFPTPNSPADNYMFKVNNSSGIFIGNFEHISQLVLVFLLLTLSW